MKLNELLGIEFPIIQGGMANIATGEFAAAVSNAGALGIIGAGGMSPEMFREHIQKCRSLTDKPFGVNIMLMHPQAPEMARIVAEEQIPVVTTGAGNPGGYVAMWKEAGCKVFPVVPAVALAKRLHAPIEKFYQNMERYGNTSAASIPIALDEMNEQGLLQPGQTIMCVGFGAGLTWGGALFQW